MSKENVQTAYKVVRVENGAWKSAIVNGKACVVYSLRNRSSGFDGTPVTVFLSERQARNWKFHWPATVVLRGAAGNPRRQPRLALLYDFLGLRSPVVRAFWKHGSKYRGDTMATPRGTHAADWFEPLEVLP